MASTMAQPILGADLEKAEEDATSTEEEANSAAAEDPNTSESNEDVWDDFEEEVNTEEQQQEAFRQYCKRFGIDPAGKHRDTEATAASTSAVQIQAYPAIACTKPVDDVIKTLNVKSSRPSREVLQMNGEDSDGEELTFCCHCKLPIGDTWYSDENCMRIHTECVPQKMQGDLEKQQEIRRLEDARLKQAARVRYDIGWRADEVPRNTQPAEDLGCYPTPQGMCCLVFDEESHSVQVAPTLEPAQAVNLEYLSLSLRVRLHEGREPLFSLDPVEACDEFKKDSMQFKRFEPEWIAGTSVGEVLFQADYHLKELSMGECSQPVIGMKNCFDYSEKEDGIDTEWTGREWFIVRKADIALTEDKVLVPRVRMGVEAREQVLRGDQLVDVRTTRRNHPLVRYAESFTHCFDLIAERKSVVFHLRELAKASVLAKMIIDGGVSLHGPWFDLGGKVKEVCSMEVPQLWNHHEHSRILMKDGSVQQADEDGQDLHECQGLYGGVNFGLERAAVSMPAMVSRGRLSVTTLLAKPTLSPAKLAPAASVAAASMSTSMVSRGRMASIGVIRAAGMPAVAAPSVSAAAARPQVGLSSVQAGLAQPASGLASVTAGLAPRPAISLQTSKLMTATGARALPSSSTKLKAVTAVLPSAGLSATSTKLAGPSRSASSLSAVTSRLALSTARPASSGLPLQAGETWGPALAAGVLASSTAGVGAGRIAALGLLADPRGVDLNLDQFNLTSPVAAEGGSWDADHSLKCAAMGSSFWACLENTDAGFCAEDKQLLQAVYDPGLSDRREEGDNFIPPDTSYDYVERLRKLVHEEEKCREQRLENFVSKEFSIANPGNLFPNSWKPRVEVSEQVPDIRELHACHYSRETLELHRMLRFATPSFDNKTEDNTRFRVYHVGSLEVRTVLQPEPGSSEAICAIFSREQAVVRDNASGICDENSKIVKITEYVERVNDRRQSYLVFECEKGNVFVTEKLASGQPTWEENPSGLDARNALAKVVRSSDALDRGIIVRSMKDIQAVHRKAMLPASSSKCKRYVQSVYSQALGAPIGDVYSGFSKCG